MPTPIREVPFLDYPIKYSNKVTLAEDGSITKIERIIWVWDAQADEYVPGQSVIVTDAVLGMQYDHRVSWLEFDLTNLRWGIDETATGGGLKDEAYSDYVFKLYFQTLDGAASHDYVFDGKRFYIPSSLTRDAGQYRIIFAVVNQQKQEAGFDHYNVADENETFISDMFTGTVVRSIYDPNGFTPIYLNTRQLKILSKTPINGVVSDDGRLGAISGGLITYTIKVANQKDNYITYVGFADGNITSKLDNFTMFICYQYLDGSGHTKVKASYLEPIDPNNEYMDNDFQYISWVPYEVTKYSNSYDAMLIGFYGEYVADASDIDLSPEELASMFELIQEEQEYDYLLHFATDYPNNETTSYLTNEGNAFTLNFTNPADTEAYLESSEDYYFYCSGFITFVVDDNFLTTDVKNVGNAVTRSGYTGEMTSAFSNIASSDGLLLGTADGGVLFANYIENEEPNEGEGE